MHFALEGVIFGLIRTLLLKIICLVWLQVKYLYQSGHHLLCLSLFLESWGCLVKKTHQNVWSWRCFGLISFIEGISIWIGYHRRCIVPSGVYWMKHIFCCVKYRWSWLCGKSVFFLVVASIDSIVGIGFPDSWNSSDEGVFVAVFVRVGCGLDTMVSMKAEYLSWELKVNAFWYFAEK